jgi:toxin-antitoxin system PIN domain toxin
MIVYLLDVNVLLALTDPMHVHHEAAHQWFSADGGRAWATCPLTENGFVRIAGHPNYPNRPGEVGAVLEILAQTRKAPGHHFWADDVSILDAVVAGTLITHAQIKDVYLLALAVGHQGRLATLDRRIPATAVRGGVEALEIIHA